MSQRTGELRTTRLGNHEPIGARALGIHQAHVANRRIPIHRVVIIARARAKASGVDSLLELAIAHPGRPLDHHHALERAEHADDVFGLALLLRVIGIEVRRLYKTARRIAVTRNTAHAGTRTIGLELGATPCRRLRKIACGRDIGAPFFRAVCTKEKSHFTPIRVSRGLASCGFCRKVSQALCLGVPPASLFLAYQHRNLTTFQNPITLSK